MRLNDEQLQVLVEFDVLQMRTIVFVRWMRTVFSTLETLFFEFDRGGSVWPPPSNAKDNQTAPKNKSI